MADDVQDVYIATEAGDAGWQSLTALAAEQVDSKLPIESEDGTVVLSGSAGSFKVNTDGDTRLQVADNNLKVWQGSSVSSIVVYGNLSQTDSWVRFAGSGADGYFGYRQAAESFLFLKSDGVTPAVTVDTGEGDLIVSNKIKTPSVSGVTDSDAEITLDSKFTVKANNKNQVQVSDTNCLKTLQVGSASQPALAFNDTSTGFFFAPDDSGRYDTNRSGIAFTIGNASSGVDPREIFRVNRSGQIVVTEDYNVGVDNALVTKKYVDDKIWVGTSAEYAAISPKLSGTLYCLTD